MSDKRKTGWLSKFRKSVAFVVLRDAVIVALAASVIGLVSNLFHPEKIPYIAKEEYEILVPCPEPGGEVTSVEATDPAVSAEDTFIVDARPKEEHAKWKYRDAVNLTYDYLDPTPDELIMELAKAIAKSRAKRVFVYGDGEVPDTGEQLGKEISGRGIKNVSFIKGGAKALVSAPAGGGKQ